MTAQYLLGNVFNRLDKTYSIRPNEIKTYSVMENVPSKPSTARVIFFAWVNFWSEHTRFLSQMENILSSILYQAVRGKIILDWVTFQGYVTLPSHGNFTQTDVVIQHGYG